MVYPSIDYPSWRQLKKLLHQKKFTGENQIRIGKVTAQIIGDKSLDKIVDEIKHSISNNRISTKL